jgi:hypothetical protein
MSDLQEYQYQLETTLSALRKDPTNTELLQLKTDLEELVALLSAAEPAPKQEMKKQWQEGQRVKARWTDGSFYEAKIVDIEGEDITISFEQHDDVQTFKASELKPLSFKVPQANMGSAVRVNAAPSKRKPERKLDQHSGEKTKKPDHVGERAKTWQQFASKTKRRSNFSTTDDLNTRIGVPNKPKK